MLKRPFLFCLCVSHSVEARPRHHQAESILVFFSLYYYYDGQDEKNLIIYKEKKNMCKGFYDAFRTVVKLL